MDAVINSPHQYLPIDRDIIQEVVRIVFIEEFVDLLTARKLPLIEGCIIIANFKDFQGLHLTHSFFPIPIYTSPKYKYVPKNTQ